MPRAAYIAMMLSLILGSVIPTLASAPSTAAVPLFRPRRARKTRASLRFDPKKVGTSAHFLVKMLGLTLSIDVPSPLTGGNARLFASI